ncbi:MAG: hypothetical protein M3O62_11190 [Pseudomonadota bacterium]|nr:hypothetical protein [Pseudomonadota bacterium]
MNTNYLPALASHARFSEWIENNEQLLASYLLLRAHSGELAGVFLSRDVNGQFLIRLCQGQDDSFMRWEDQRRCRSHFGRAYAEALVQAWLTRLETQHWQLEWSAQHTEAVAPRLDEPGLAISRSASSPQYARAW